LFYRAKFLGRLQNGFSVFNGLGQNSLGYRYTIPQRIQTIEGLEAAVWNRLVENIVSTERLLARPPHRTQEARADIDTIAVDDVKLGPATEDWDDPPA